MEPVKIADRELMAATRGSSCYICHEDRHGKEEVGPCDNDVINAWCS